MDAMQSEAYYDESQEGFYSTFKLTNDENCNSRNSSDIVFKIHETQCWNAANDGWNKMNARVIPFTQ